jgi:hypothetical protein
VLPIIIKRDRTLALTVWNKLTLPFMGNDRAKDINHANVSDLVGWCIRKSYFNKVYPTLEVKDPEQLNSFIRGKMSEYVISNRVFGGSYKEQVSYVLNNKIKAHPDLIDETRKHVIELKDSNNDYHFTDPRHTKYNSFDSYMMQLLAYMIITGCTTGSILVRHSNAKKIIERLGWKKIEIDNKEDKMPMWAYTVELAIDDPIRDFIRDNLLLKAEYFINAVKNKRVETLPRLRDIKSSESKCMANMRILESGCGRIT